MNISFSDRVTVPEDVLISGLQDESVLLNLDSERYYGLDDVGTRMFSLLTTSDCVQTAWERLQKEYDVDHEILKQDLISLVNTLLEQGLIEVTRKA